MKFYLCKTASGLQLASTQTDAKSLDKSFKEHDVPTSKPELMAYINDLLADLHDAQTTGGDDGLDHEGEEAVTDDRPSKPVTTQPGDCPACHRSAVAADMAANGMALTDIEEAIFYITDLKVLDRVGEALDERIDELKDGK